MNSIDLNRKIEAFPEESRLVHRAKTGDAEAFVQLYDVYGDNVYRYVYFRVMSDVAAEVITSRVFRYAWEHLESYQKNGSPFITWIYNIARYQVIAYCKANIKTEAFDLRFLSLAVDYGLITEDQDPETWRNHLQLLTADKQETLNHNRTLQVVTRYLEYLIPRREVKPSPTFNAYTRSWLNRYLLLHAHRPKKPSILPRMALTYAVLIAALLITGTAKAQSALPGDVLYGLKRTSEQAWLFVSPDPVGTDIVLANRRLDEWMAVQKDPTRSTYAQHDYFEALTDLQSAGDAGTRVRVTSLLKTHRQILNTAGVSTTQLDRYLVTGVNPIPTAASTQVSPTEASSPATQVPVVIGPPATEVPKEGALPATQPPTTEVATEVTAPPTEAPTEVAPPATEVPTEVAPPPTEVPTEVAPPATEVPTEVAPPATEPPPTEAAPPATEAPTDAPESMPTDATP